MTGRRPKKNPSLKRPFVVTVAIGLPTVVAIGCGTSKPAPSAGGSSSGGPTPAPIGSDACTTEGETRTCHTDLGMSGGLQNCFYGTQSCLGGRWSACGGTGTILSAKQDGIAAAYEKNGLATKLQNLAAATGALLDASAGSSLCKKACMGGPNFGVSCNMSSDCPAWGCSRRCVGGSNAGGVCNNNGDCPGAGGSCPAGKVCLGGPNGGQACNNSGDCGDSPVCITSDVCNPNCQGWDMNGGGATPTGDAGIGVAGFGQIPGGQINKLLNDACHPGGLGTCNQGANTLYSCQMDTYCDMASGCCKQFPVSSTMNGTVGGPGTYASVVPPAPDAGTDAGTGGDVDITIGPGCCDNCRTYRDYPICNRGTAPIAPGTVITTHIVNPNSTQNPCPTYASPKCSTTVDATHGADAVLGLLPGQCMLMNMATDCVGGEPSGEWWLYTNANGSVAEGNLTNVPATVPATTPGCANNWSDHTNNNNPPACRTSSTNSTFISDFYATCPPGYIVQWGNLTWQSTQGNSGTDLTEILFEAATAPAYPDGGPSAPLSAYYEIGEASKGSNALDTDDCTFVGPASSSQCTNATAAGAIATGPTPPCCPKNFLAQFSRPTTVTTALFAGAGPTQGKVLAQQPFLEMRITLRSTTDGKASPTLSAWSIDYNCVPNE